MVSCEKCWVDSGAHAYHTGGIQTDIYRRMVAERDCTPEEQAGRDAAECPECGRKAEHQFTGQCMACRKETT